MKKGILLLISCLFFGISAVAEPVTGVALDKTTMTLVVGTSGTLTATVSPGDATNKAVTWASGNINVATVDGTGKVTAVSKGSATVTVTTEDQSKTETCTVTVVEISLEATKILSVGDTDVPLSLTILPDGATTPNLTWESDNINVATVDGDKVTAVSAGTATITVKVDNTVIATCLVTVAAQRVTGVSLKERTLELVVGASETLTATVSPDNATIKTVKWSSDDVNIAKVDATGKVTAVSAGTATVTVTTDDQGEMATCPVTVTDSVHVTKVTLDKVYIELHVDSVATIKATIEPGNATDKSMIFSSDDPSIVEIISDIDGVCKIKAKSTGQANITATTADGKKTTACYIDVPSFLLTGLNLIEDVVILGENDSVKLLYTLTPLNTTQKGLSWKSDNPDVATVSDSGVVKTKVVGYAYISVESTSNPDLKDKCLIEVIPAKVPVTGVSIKESISLIEGDSEQLTVDILPVNASNKNVTWTIQDASVATVSSTGLVKAVKAGTTYVYVETADAYKKDTCIVNIREKVIISNPPEATVRSGSFPLSVKVPNNGTFTGEFIIAFPVGIVLDEANTDLVPAYKQQGLSLNISGAGTNAWKMAIISETPRSTTLRAGFDQQIMNIAYTISKLKPNGTYDIDVSNAVFKFSDGTEIREEKITVPLTVRIDETSNTDINNGKAQVYAANNRLFVQSASAETIYIYSFNGTLLYTNIKEAGEAAFDLNIQEPAFIVKGSSGWTEKIVK